MTEKLISFGATNAEFTVDFDDVEKLKDLVGLLPEGSKVSFYDRLGEFTLKDNRRVLIINTAQPLNIYNVIKAVRTKIYA